MKALRDVAVGVDLTSGDRLVAGLDDLAPSCRAAIERAAWLVRKFGATLHVLTSLDVDAFAESLIVKQHEERGDSVLDAASRVLDAFAARAREEGSRVTTEIAFGRPARVLVDDAIRNGRDLVVVGIDARGGRVRTRTALQLIRHCPSPVWISRARWVADPASMLAAVDHDAVADDVVDFAAAICGATGARLHVLHVVDESSARVLRVGGASTETVEAYRAARRASVDPTLQKLVVRALASRVEAQAHVRVGDAAEGIRAAADELAADVVVLGTREHGALRAALWGSVAETVLTTGDASLVVVKHGTSQSG